MSSPTLTNAQIFAEAFRRQSVAQHDRNVTARDPEPGQWLVGTGWSEFGQTDRVIRFESGQVTTRPRAGYQSGGGATWNPDALRALTEVK